ncbi:MAG: hypothetical protein ACXABY_05890 [Candidatus Thorarchaeota archaeon]
MNVQDFLSEWEAISKGTSGLSVDYQMGILDKWVDIRKDQAVQEAKNKWWADFLTGMTNSLKQHIDRLPEDQKTPAVESISDVIAKLEEAMEKHRKMHGEQQDSSS